MQEPTVANLERRIAELEAALSQRRGLRPARGARRFALLAALVAIPLTAYASLVGSLTVFSNGTLADADQMNDNFTLLQSWASYNDARLDSVYAHHASTYLVESPAASGVVTASCNAGDQIVAGGCFETSGYGQMMENGPIDTSSWRCKSTNYGNGAATPTEVRILCRSPL